MNNKRAAAILKDPFVSNTLVLSYSTSATSVLPAHVDAVRGVRNSGRSID